MAVIDIVFLVIIALSCIMGGFRGLVKEAFSLATWIGAIVIGTLLYEPMAGLLTGIIDNSSLRNLSAFAILFVLTILIGTIISNLMKKLMQAAGLGGADRVLGALFGILRGLIIISLIVLVTTRFDFTSNWYEGSFMVPYVLLLIDYLQQLFNNAEENTDVAGTVVLTWNQFTLSEIRS
jgi:membrane protein required for colicin V production